MERDRLLHMASMIFRGGTSTFYLACEPFSSESQSVNAYCLVCESARYHPEGHCLATHPDLFFHHESRSLLSHASQNFVDASEIRERAVQMMKRRFAVYG